MKAHEILSTLQGLAKCQGFYGRLLDNLIENDMLMETLNELEKMNFKDTLDLVLYFEC